MVDERVIGSSRFSSQVRNVLVFQSHDNGTGFHLNYVA